jgi:hypothetical protein
MSAGRLAGNPVAGLRQHVRDTFLGTSTCTHLNDTLRSLEDIPALLELAGSPAASGGTTSQSLTAQRRDKR